MDFKGCLDSINKDLSTGEFIIQIRTKQDVLAAFQKLKDIKELVITLKRFRKKRSLTANSYYWTLIGKVSEVLRVSPAYLHNHMLRRHPRPELFDERMVDVLIPETEEAQRKVDEAETYHLLPTDILEYGTDGSLYRRYIMLKGSSDYDTKEMAALIDDIVSEAKELGIETLPPAEIERMKQEWGIDIA